MATATNGGAKAPKVNRIGLEDDAYKGGKSTLCKGCGHDSITNSIIQSFYEMGVEPNKVAKVSGIGCSSKTTAYFLSQSHGFNAVHGRMSAITTGSALANRTLVNIGVSGDGDTASIGLGNFLHMVRRNVPIIYIIEDNGCYGLTKGQFSATADKGSVLKKGTVNEMPAIDCCALAIQMGCGYVGRSYSGDFNQVRSLIKGAISHRGSAVLDIISPCITFNDHEGSTKSFAYVKSHKDSLEEVDFVPFFQDIEIDYAPGEAKVVDMPDGSKIVLKKLEHDYDPTSKKMALDICEKGGRENFFHTGLIYYDASARPMDQQMNLIDEPLATLPESRTRPSVEVFNKIVKQFM